ncbi:MAG TPA: ComEA family DNA-binding protein [Gaiellaceae bacterium]|nr:ComEA family DNA-binding protein [Gaiellaceae bacterium]
MASFPLTRRQALVVTGVLAVTLFLAAKVLLPAGAPRAAAPTLPVSTAPARAPRAALVVVDVAGAVRRPGLYRLPARSRVADAVARAGGASAKADLEGVNLAAPVADGEQVVVPRRTASPGAASTRASGTPAPSAPVSLSTATADELDALPGVGPVTAQKILDYRARHGAFRSVDELDAIPGIGPARLEQLRPLVVP